MNMEQPEGGLARLAAGGVVFTDLTQQREPLLVVPFAEVAAAKPKPAKRTRPSRAKQKTDENRDKNDGRDITPTTPPQHQENTIMEKQHVAGTNGAGTRTDDGLSALERLCAGVADKLAAGTPVARVEVVRPLGEKLIDTGILCGALFAAGTAVVAVARFGFGIGKVHAPLSGPTT